MSRILIVFDLLVSMDPNEYHAHRKTEDWRTLDHVATALEKLGHEVDMLGVYNDLQPFLNHVAVKRPDFIFNLSEAYDGDRHFEPHLVALFELLKIPYTGAKFGALNICKDKGLTKKILSYHRIRVPLFLVSHKSRPLKTLGRFQFPVFIKPLNFEASEGISQLSFAETEKDALDRVRFIHEKLGADAIVEEYIEGREIYVGVMGTEKLKVLPPRELFFAQVPEGEPRFATFRAKWDKAYRKRWGIESGPAKPFSAGLERKILETSKKIYRLLRMSGYARIDLRVKDSGEIVFLEANPNPAIGKDEDFASAAQKAGIDYKTLIQRIVGQASL